MKWMLNCDIYVKNIVLPALFLFLQQVGDMLFQQDNAYLHDAYATQHALQDVRQLPWLVQLPDIRFKCDWTMFDWFSCHTLLTTGKGIE